MNTPGTDMIPSCLKCGFRPPWRTIWWWWTGGCRSPRPVSVFILPPMKRRSCRRKAKAAARNISAPCAPRPPQCGWIPHMGDRRPILLPSRRKSVPGRGAIFCLQARKGGRERSGNIPNRYFSGGFWCCFMDTALYGIIWRGSRSTASTVCIIPWGGWIRLPGRCFVKKALRKGNGFRRIPLGPGSSF